LIKEWKTEKDILIISLTENFPIQETSEYEREKIYEKWIRRILLFKLYDIYRIKNNRFTAFPLASLSGLINKDKKEIYRHVSFLQGEYYLEYEVCDGGQCTSDITDYGINLCEDKLELFSIFSVVKLMIKEEEKKEKKEVGELADDYVAKQRIEQFNSIKHNDFDLTKLIQLCKELNVRFLKSLAIMGEKVLNN